MSKYFLKKIKDSSNLLDILIQVEDFLDSLDIYVYDNWIDGIIVNGPEVDRYWVKVSIRYDYDSMPDPQGGLRLLRYGAKVFYRKFNIEIPKKILEPNDYREGQPGKPELEIKKIWIVTLHIPRHYIEELDDDDLELYSDEMDIEDVSDARDEGSDEEPINSEDMENNDENQ